MKASVKSAGKTTKMSQGQSQNHTHQQAHAAAMMDTAETMAASDLKFFKSLLIEQRSEILNKTETFKAESAIEITSQGDEGDLAVSELSLSISLRLQERQTQLLQKIDRALSKIEDGSFGLCEQCDELLNVNRLKARPVATLCIACKEEQENKERVFA
jgi:DnaK suppressor protein